MGHIILIIEDNELIKDLYVEWFNTFYKDFYIKIVSTLRDAKSYIRENLNKIKLIISDCDLPDGKACELFKIKNLNKPLIITTGSIEPEEIEKIKEKYKSPIEVLLKPFQLEILNEKINKYL